MRMKDERSMMIVGRAREIRAKISAISSGRTL
jgi:hypothetical protein